jgi:hypothetical protein
MQTDEGGEMNALDVAWTSGTAAGSPDGIVMPDGLPVAGGMEHASGHNDDARARILDEAAEALRTAGSDITDIESVVAMMRRTTARQIDDEFGGMDGLVAALAEQLCASMLEPLDRPPTAASFKGQLLEFADRLVDAYSFSHLRGLYRIAVAAATRLADHGRTFYLHGPGLLTTELARFISDAHDAGLIRTGDSPRLANHLVALLRADMNLSDPAPSTRPNNSLLRKGNVSRAIELFCSGIWAGENDASTDP